MRTVLQPRELLRHRGDNVPIRIGHPISAKLLREHNDRGQAAGEGTGKALDLDPWDENYLHLFVWAPDDREIVGAYRLGQTDEILREHGTGGLYSSIDFRYDEKLFDTLGPALELGRSFIQPRYQRQFNSLLLLWQGIGQFIARKPHYTKLFGMVSISNDYQGISRTLISNVLKHRYASPELGDYVRPCHAFSGQATRHLQCSEVATWGEDVNEVSSWVADLEEELPGVPVLVRQYVKMGAEILAFNVDPRFGNTLDGLIVVDLKRTEPHQLRTFFGKETAEKLRAA